MVQSERADYVHERTLLCNQSTLPGEYHNPRVLPLKVLTHEPGHGAAWAK